MLEVQPSEQQVSTSGGSVGIRVRGNIPESYDLEGKVEGFGLVEYFGGRVAGREGCAGAVAWEE